MLPPPSPRSPRLLRLADAFPTLAALAAAVLVALAASPLFAADPTLALEHGASSGHLALRISDPANATWQLQTSTDLNTWQNRETFRVRNTDHAYDVDNSVALPGVFFRLVPAAEPLANTAADATILPVTPDNFSVLDLPPHLLVPIITGQNNTPGNNPVTDAGATLGRVLFYDKRLSANNTIACASCHQPAHGFSDPRQFSVGFAGGLTDRNSMGLTSAKF
ncbi:MAG: cytochrome-c peroxidase, partial [Burkholderiales bacterium]|nr:cytochrome-c peroxidase [Opitutaceae bacterium]